MVFDIETVPDVETGRRLYDLDGIDDPDVARVLAAKRREQTGDSDFLPHYLHRIVAIAVALRSKGGFKVWSLGGDESSEGELIERFFEGIEKFVPTLVSWNGGGFDLPVLHYRALLHGVRGGRYWETGDLDRDFRYNNYLSRFHWRHIDLMDVLSAFQPRASAPLDRIAVMLGLPGKSGMDGSAVWDSYQAGRLEEIRNYCETDVLNTYLVYLRWQLTAGRIERDQYAEEQELVRSVLVHERRPHFDRFLEAWNHALGRAAD
jgi:hypothetical protein